MHTFLDHASCHGVLAWVVGCSLALRLPGILTSGNHLFSLLDGHLGLDIFSRLLRRGKKYILTNYLCLSSVMRLFSFCHFPSINKKASRQQSFYWVLGVTQPSYDFTLTSCDSTLSSEAIIDVVSASNQVDRTRFGAFKRAARMSFPSLYNLLFQQQKWQHHTRVRLMQSEHRRLQTKRKNYEPSACIWVLTWLWWSMYWHFWPREIGGEKVEEKTGSWGCRGGRTSERRERKEGMGRNSGACYVKERRPQTGTSA